MTLDPCGAADHPCTLAGVTPEADARTDELAELLRDRLSSAADLAAAAQWLETQEDVASVAAGAEAVRFRVRGGVGHWIFVRTAGTVGTLGAVTIPVPASSPARRSAESDATTQSPAAPAPTPRKKALLLSPFRWQWEVQGLDDGIDEVARVLRARDYRPEDVTVLTEGLDPGNPACRSAERWRDCKTIRQIQPSAFMSWRDYKYVHLLTHGGAVSNGRGHVATAVMTPWTIGAVTTARERYVEAGQPDLVQIVDRVGVETGSVFMLLADSALVPEVGPGQTVEEYVPRRELERVPVTYNPELTPAQRTRCGISLSYRSDMARREAREPLAEIGGKPCLLYAGGVKTGKFVLLTSHFFRDTYSGGIDNAIVLISACSSGVKTDLLTALSGNNTAVIGWKDSIAVSAAAAAGTLIAKTLVEVDEPAEPDSGLTVAQAIKRIRDKIDEVNSNPPSEAACAAPPNGETAARCAMASNTQLLTVINDVPADRVTGASLVVEGDATVRAREIVYLVDESGADLRKGSLLSVVGVPGDGRQDSVALRLRVDGLGLEETPGDVDLTVTFEGRSIAVDRRLRESAVRGVWESDYALPLGRDYTVGEIVDLEVAGRLPGGHDSRWLYEDLVLANGCYWTAEQTGPGARQYSGDVAWAGAHVGWGFAIELGYSKQRRQPGALMMNLLVAFDERPQAGSLAMSPGGGKPFWAFYTPEGSAPYGATGNLDLSVATDQRIEGTFSADVLKLETGMVRVEGRFVSTKGCPNGAH